MRDALCSGNVAVLSEQGKAFIIGCGLKWHVLYADGKKSRSVLNIDATAPEIQKWPEAYMEYMAKFKGESMGVTWDERLTASGLKQNGLDLFWARTCRRNGEVHPPEDCTLASMRWEGYVEQHMVLESNAEWMAARQLLGLRALRPGSEHKPEEVGN